MRDSRPTIAPERSAASDRATNELRWAVGRENLERIKSALAKGADVNARGKWGRTALHEAAESGQTEIAASLIAHGADLSVKAEDWGDASALHLAAESGHAETAGLLIAHGADVNARNVDGMTPLHRAAWNGHKAVAELLIAHGADVRARDAGGSTPLHQVTEADYLWTAGACIEARDGRVDLNDNDTFAARRDAECQLATRLKLEMINLLVVNGADVNAEDYLGGRPLSGAVLFGEVPVVELLLTKGANPERRSKFDGSTLLHDAVREDRMDIIPVLLKYGADINARDGNRQTLLHEAIWADSNDTAKLLIAGGADINVKDKNGDTPAHVAAMTGSEELLAMLVSHGADMRARNKERLTPADCLRSGPPKEMIRLSPDASLPYSVIVTDVRNIRNTLQNRTIDFDRIWIPTQSDITDVEAILGDRYDDYNREYASFTRGRRKYVFINVNRCHERSVVPKTNEFSPIPFDGGCSFMRIVIDLSRRRIVRTECNGF